MSKKSRKTFLKGPQNIPLNWVTKKKKNLEHRRVFEYQKEPGFVKQQLQPLLTKKRSLTDINECCHESEKTACSSDGKTKDELDHLMISDTKIGENNYPDFFPIQTIKQRDVSLELQQEQNRRITVVTLLEISN